MSRLIMHVDLDAFFAAIEQRDHPEWRGLPLVVGAEPGKRGVVATCSYEARRYGMHSAMPISEAARLIGLGLSGWGQQAVQPDLFGADETPDPHPREDRLHETLDAIRAKFGKGTIQRGLYRRK